MSKTSLQIAIQKVLPKIIDLQFAQVTYKVKNSKKIF